MTFTFRSHELVRVLTVDDVHSLDLDEARRFSAELTVAIESLRESIDDATAGRTPYDFNWMHRARKKHRVALAFSLEVRRHLESLESGGCYDLCVQRTKFQDLRYQRLLEILRVEFEPEDVTEMDEEARQGAEQDFKEWLAEGGHKQVFTP